MQLGEDICHSWYYRLCKSFLKQISRLILLCENGEVMGDGGLGNAREMPSLTLATTSDHPNAPDCHISHKDTLTVKKIISWDLVERCSTYK